MTHYELQRYHLLHEMRTLRAKARLGLQTAGERRTIIKTMALLRKSRAAAQMLETGSCGFGQAL